VLPEDKVEVAKLILALWEGSMPWYDGVVTSAREEARWERGKGGYDASWAAMNLSGSKNEENPRGQFSCYGLTVKI
jgi:hypothetical protein